MKRRLIAKKYTYSFGLAAVTAIFSSYLWALSGTSPFFVMDTNSKLTDFADMFGGMQFLASISGLLSACAAVSGLMTVAVVLVFLYSTFCGRRASKAINNLLKVIPSMPDKESLEAMADHGINIDGHILTIAKKHLRLATAKDLSHTISHLLYLYSRDNLDILLSGEHTVLHQLAAMLTVNADDVDIRQFIGVMRKRKLVLGELLDAALVRIDLEAELSELQAKIEEVTKREQAALAMAKNQLADHTDRVNRLASRKKLALVADSGIRSEIETPVSVTLNEDEGPISGLVRVYDDKLNQVASTPGSGIAFTPVCQPLVTNHPPITESLEDEAASEAGDKPDHSFDFTPEPPQSGVWERSNGVVAQVS